MENKKYDVIVIGAGITGSFIARTLIKYKLNVLVIEKENDVGNVTTMANSAIIHAGYDPLPGSLKAILNVKGARMYEKICQELDVSYRKIGSLTVALNKEEYEIIKKLKERADLNGVESKILTSLETKSLEPNISDEVTGSLYVKDTGIIDPFNLCVAVMENAVDNGVVLHLNEEVQDIKYTDNLFNLKTNKNNYLTKIVINAAGLNGNRIARMVSQTDFEIIPRKGEYFVLDHYRDDLVKHVVFPVPSEKGKGILVSPTTSGNYILGPSSEVSTLDDLSTDKETLDNVYLSANKMIKNIDGSQVIRTFSGIRATPSTHDFYIKASSDYPSFINVIGIESPGLASSPAVAEYVVNEFVKKVLDATKNDNYSPTIRPHIITKRLSDEQKDELIKKDRDFGKIICLCEKITLGEIKDVLNRSVPPTTIKGIKKRTRAGFGKCQGGFCQPQVLRLLAKTYNLDLKDILYDKDKSNVLIERSKEAHYEKY